jgi:biopolymer transport protein ExbD
MKYFLILTLLFYSCVEKKKDYDDSMEIVLINNEIVFVAGKRAPIESFEAYFLKEHELLLKDLHPIDGYNVNLKVAKEVKMSHYLKVSNTLKKHKVNKIIIHNLED